MLIHFSPATVDSVKIPYPIIQETSFVMQYIVVKSGKNGKNWFKNGLKMVFSHIFDGLKMFFFAISDGLFFLEPVGTYVNNKKGFVIIELSPTSNGTIIRFRLYQR